jgi:hypothetical protein
VALIGAPESDTGRQTNVVVKTPEQLEDAAIADAIRSVVGLKTRAMHRELVTNITDKVDAKIRKARLQGKRVDVNRFIEEVVREVAATQ